MLQLVVRHLYYHLQQRGIKNLSLNYIYTLEKILHSHKNVTKYIYIYTKMSLSLFTNVTNVTREVSGHISLVLYYLQGIFTLSQSL